MTSIDAASRHTIATKLDVNMMVEAAAGTGKTTSLVTRAVALLRSGRCDVSSLAAITFTVKAAAQLRERLHAALEKELRENPSQERIAAALRSLDRAFIGTTHAFCARLLRERPIEAGLDPEFEEVDQVEAMLLTREFWRRWEQSHAAVGAPEIVQAREAGLTSEVLGETFVRLVEFHGDVEIASVECARPDLAGGVASIRAVLRMLEHDLPDGSAPKQDDFEVMVRKLLRMERSRDLRDPLEQLVFLSEGAHASRKPTQKNWPDKVRAKAYGLAYAPAGAAAKVLLRSWKEYAHCVAMNVIRLALEDYARERRQTSKVTFQDLLVSARNLLRDHPQVRRYFQRRFTHVLVDEFQDTDPLQAEMLFYLTGTETEEKRGSHLTPRPGSLFIVGDPKQSIYRFRRADITTYVDVRKRIDETDGRIVQLSTNYRSARAVCEYVNATFPAIFTAASVAAEMQAPHIDLGAHHEGGAIDGVYVLEQQDARAADVSAAEAACIARWIRNAVTSGLRIVDDGVERAVRWSDFLLVSRVKTRLHHYAAALESEDVPFEVTGAQRFGESAWLHAVLPLLHAVVDPDDPVAVAAFLRGALCGAGDDELYAFVERKGRWSPFAELPVGTPASIADGFAMLRAAIEDARELPPAAAIARTFERVGLAARAAADAQPGTSAGNTLLALAIAREESARGASYAVVVERLGEMLEEDIDLEEMDVDPSRENAVRLMNLHQAKGLEAAIVFLIDPAKGGEFEPDRVIDRRGDVSQGWFAVFRKKNFTRENLGLPRQWDVLARREQQYRDAEDQRLLYVAATRAKSVLVVGVTLKNGRSGRWAALADGVSRTLFGVSEGAIAGSPAAGESASFVEAMKDMDGRRAHAAAHSYSVAPVTKIAHDHAKLVKVEEGLGRGTSWGRVLHRLFEAMLREPEIDVRFYAESLLKDEERDAAEIDDVLDAVVSLRSSELWQRVLAADEKYAEVPFALEVPARSVGIDFDGVTLLHGAIDLVFREGDVWWIVDYKSDSTAGRLEMLVAYYRSQVEHYARFWSQLTGAETRAGLFFVDGGRAVWVG